MTNITQGTSGTRASTFSYDAQGYLAGVTDPLGRAVSFAYDLAGRVTRQTLPDGRVINYTYDANGNVTSITPPGRPAHAFAYTPVDLESTYNPPNIGLPNDVTQYAYNLDKDLTQITRPDGQTINYVYDAGGRLATVTQPRGVTSYAYDPANGNLTGITAPDGGTISYTYDGSLLLSTTWGGVVSGSISRTYDADFRITSRSVNGASVVNFGFDSDGLLASAGALTLTRNAQNGFLTGTTLGSITDGYTYSAFGEVSGYTAGNAGASALLNVQYTRDALGRITQKVETIGGVTTTYAYSYDTAGRLTDVSKNGAVVSSYTYDANGNRITATVNGVTSQGFYDLQDRMTKYGAATYAYTANGELSTKTGATGTTSYSYDVFGNLMSVTLPDGTLVEYVIDGNDRRIGKKVNGVLTQGFLYKDSLNPIAELDSTGNLVSRFIYATKSNVPDYMVKGGVTYRIISDHLGSPRLVVDTATGTVIQQIDYDEFGNVISDTNPGFQPFGYAGGIYDQHTKLTRFGARDYDASTGRWTSKDPIGFNGQDANFYGYVFNDPVNWVDPNGEFALLLVPLGEALFELCAANPLACGGGAWALSEIILCHLFPDACGLPPLIPPDSCPVPPMQSRSHNSGGKGKGERNEEKGRGDDPYWGKTPDDLKGIENNPNSTLAERKRAKRIRKQKQKKRRR